MAKNQLIFRTKEAQYIPIEETIINQTVDIAIFQAGADGSVIKSINFLEDIVLFVDDNFSILYNDGQTDKIIFRKNSDTAIDLSTINLVSLISSTTDSDGKIYLQIPANSSIILKVIKFSGTSINLPYGYIQGEDY